LSLGCFLLAAAHCGGSGKTSTEQSQPGQVSANFGTGSRGTNRRPPNDSRSRHRYAAKGARLGVSMATFVLPVIRSSDYDTFRRIKDLNLPDTHDTWLKVSSKKSTDLKAEGYVVTEFEVNPDEFIRHCAAGGTKSDSKALDTFALEKWRRRP
jgi:hypothetical protein